MNEKVKGKVEGNDEDAINQNLPVIERLKRLVGANSDADLARYLGRKPQNIVAAKKKGVPDAWLVKASKDFGTTVNEILHGKDSIESGTRTPEQLNMKDESQEYGPTKFGDMNKDEWEILGKAYKIITSQSEYKSPLIQCINAFHEALAGRQEIETLKMRIQVLQKVNKANNSKGIEEEDQNRSAI